MFPRQAKRNTQKFGRQPPVPKDQGKRPQGIKKERLQLSSRKSARLEEIQRRQERTVSKDRNTEPKHSLPSPTRNTSGKEACHSPANRATKLTQVKFIHTKDRKRKLSQEDEATLPSTATPSQKRPRTSPPRSRIQETIGDNTAVGISEKEINPLEYWRRELRWPKEYFEPESNMNHLLARKKSSSSLRGKQSEAGSATPSSTAPSNQTPREAKSTPYTRPSYETVLATK
ncbi:hypothetical protein MMC31_006342, partial [Peltigera leucophlebia]|nr:hypothetical protein [Peltigera leucophlebia]